MSEWLKVVMAGDCDECQDCGEPVCPECDEHYADCDCPGPTQDDIYEYRTTEAGELQARELDQEGE